MRSKATREKISKTLTGRTLPKEHRRNISEGLRGRKHSEETKRKIGEAHRGMSAPYVGEKNHKWKGGLGSESYPSEFKRIREEIRERDNHTCQLCGKTKQPNGYKLDVHHIDYNKRNSDPKNLITLCSSCNKEVDANDEKEVWEHIFRRRIKDI